jgi:hypothetical protein
MRKPYYTYSGGLDGWHSTTDGGWGCVLIATTYGQVYGETTISAWGGFEGSRLQGWYQNPYSKRGYNFASSASVSVSGTTASVSSHTDLIYIYTYGSVYYPIPEGGQPVSGELRRYISSDVSQTVQFASTENGDVTWSGEGSGQVSVYGKIVPISLKHSGVLRMLGRDVEAVLDGTMYYQGSPNPPYQMPGDPIWGIHLDLTLKDLGPGIRGAVQYVVVEQYFPTQVTTIEKKVPTLVAAPAPAPTPALPALVTFSLAALVLSLLSLALAIRK